MALTSGKVDVPVIPITIRRISANNGPAISSVTYTSANSSTRSRYSACTDRASCTASSRWSARNDSTDPPDSWRVVELPTELLDEATGIDGDAVRSWVRANTLAFGTEQRGTVVTGPVVLAGATARSTVVDALADVLRQRYDSVERAGGELRAREQRFDPDRAATLGIPEGPKYGKLSAGQPVEVDGREIDPETVHSERIRRFTL